MVDPQRSGIPKVMGILMIIFASLGLLFGLIGLAGSSLSATGLSGDLESAVKTYNTIALVFGVLGLGVSALHLVAGINALKYKAGAPKLALMYGGLAIVVQVLYGALVFAWLKPKLGEAGSLLGAGVLLGVVIGSIWPILVLSLMSRPAAKVACTN